MMDFLKVYPFVTMDDYIWRYSVPMIKVMSADATKTLYLSEKQAKKYRQKNSALRIDDPSQLMSDTGAPVFNE